MKMSIKHWCKNIKRENRNIERGTWREYILRTYLHKAEINLHNVRVSSVRVGGCAA
jgi:hypothetical protein